MFRRENTQRRGKISPVQPGMADDYGLVAQPSTNVFVHRIQRAHPNCGELMCEGFLV